MRSLGEELNGSVEGDTGQDKSTEINRVEGNDENPIITKKNVEVIIKTPLGKTSSTITITTTR